MTTAYDVPPDRLIKALAEKLKKNPAVKPPEWAPFVKTGPHKEMAPEDPDWWYTRAAAVLRKIYVMGPIGIERLAAEYGGKRDRGSKRYHAVKGSRSIARKCVQQLEAAGLIEKCKNRGRVVSAHGRKLVDYTAFEVMKDLIKEIPEMKKYASKKITR